MAKVREELDDEVEMEPLREHLADLHPVAMTALLNASVFKLRWIHDYQGVCFPPKDEKIRAAAPVSLQTFLMAITLMIGKRIKTGFRSADHRARKVRTIPGSLLLSKQNVQFFSIEFLKNKLL